MKTAISIPDDLFERADRYARRTGRSRSEVYRDAIREYLNRRDVDEVTRAYDAVLDEVGAEIDEWTSVAARRAMERIEW